MTPPGVVLIELSQVFNLDASVYLREVWEKVQTINHKAKEVF